MSDFLKNSLNLPHTSFPMKAALQQKEPKIVDFWQTNKIYEEMVSSGTEDFNFIDGPPYANGSIHLGHVLNKIIKDIVVKYKCLKNKKAYFKPGWDCHGLPIEHKVLSKLGSKSKDMTDEEIRNLCEKEARKWINQQKKEFIRLGILADWNSPYITMDNEYQARELRVFANIFKRKLINRGQKPVYWCVPLSTALAEAEVIYLEKTSPSIYVKFYLKDLSSIGTNKRTAFVIWTTTPWTLPANLAIALGKDFNYGIYEARNNDENLIIATQLAESFSKNTDQNIKLVKTFKGSELELIETEHPFMNRSSKIILAPHVSLETGTGCVHTAPGHGIDDYKVGLKYNLDILSVVNDRGLLTKDAGKYKGNHVFKVNNIIIEDLKKSGHLIHFSELQHSYPHCWRSETPLIFRATHQWFLNMKTEDIDLVEEALKVIKTKIKFIPSWGLKRMASMLENRPDWCLSRQRLWGVPIPIFSCKDCGTAYANYNLMLRIADFIAKEGSTKYFDKDDKYFLTNDKCNNCSSTNLVKEKDILDVWFDSGVSHSAVDDKNNNLTNSIYIEGSDQHRGWFQTSLLSSLAATGKAPYKTLVTHGFVNDKHGIKMSKSKGNILSCDALVKQYGAETLRLWIASEDYSKDTNVSIETFTRIQETYRKFRNTIRFIISNLFDFDNEKNLIKYEQRLPIDQWMYNYTIEVMNKVDKHYENLEFHKSLSELNQFVVLNLSAFYLDILKDRLYTAGANSLLRRSAQSTLFHIKDLLIIYISPILSFLAEEVNLLENPNKSIFTKKINQLDFKDNYQILKNDFSFLIDIKKNVSREIETKRKEGIIGSSLEVQLVLHKKTNYTILKKYEKYLCEIFNVSSVEIKESENDKTEVRTAKGEKCPRCWTYSEKLSEFNKTKVCTKCQEALKEYSIS